MKRVIFSKEAPAAVGPYSQAVEAGGVLYISGQLPVDGATNSVPESVEEQTVQSLKNVEAILVEAGYTRADVVKSTVLLSSMDDFAAMNKIYGEFYSEPYPARVCYQVAKLPLGVKVEIETIATKG